MKLEEMKTVVPTPWGIAQRYKEFAPGITYYSTHCHGGYYLSPERNAMISIQVKEGTWCGLGVDGWYEEDYDGAIVKKAFPEYFKGWRSIEDVVSQM